MSGHSHYATIHRQKEINDSARGNLFSKLARAITLAVKAGGPNPESNFKLRVAIEKGRAANMPKENVERAISKAEGGESLEEATYEGFGPGGISVIVETATDNRNRTGQEMKNLFERAGGRLSGPGSVSFNFEPRGLILVKKSEDPQAQMLSLIDLGVEEMEETEDGVEVYVSSDKISETKKNLEAAGFTISSFEITQKPKMFQEIGDKGNAAKAISFLDTVNAHEDVQKVYANLDIPNQIMEELKAKG